MPRMVFRSVRLQKGREVGKVRLGPVCNKCQHRDDIVCIGSVALVRVSITDISEIIAVTTNTATTLSISIATYTSITQKMAKVIFIISIQVRS